MTCRTVRLAIGFPPEAHKTGKGVQRRRPNLLIVNGAPGTTRTCDPLIRSQVLYPAELRVLIGLVGG